MKKNSEHAAKLQPKRCIARAYKLDELGLTDQQLRQVAGTGISLLCTDICTYLFACQ